MAEPRLLIVEDEASLRMTLAANLELEGFEVVEADSAEAALERIERESFDLVLSDIRMPGLSGVDMHKVIKAKRADLPVVLMTAFTSEDKLDEATQSGVFTVLSKPFEVDDVIPTLVGAMSRPVVLIVDGDPTDAVAIAGALSERGIVAEPAADCRTAVALMADRAVDVCVTCLRLADGEGATIIHTLRSHHEGVAVIAVANGEGSERLHSVAEAGAATFLEKPLDPAVLISAIAKARARSLPRV